MASVRLPSIEGLRAFEAAARLGSFERAAHELNVTPSAVSKRVAAVEDNLGEPLFARAPNALQLTPTGREYHTQISQVLNVLTSMPIHQRGAEERTDRLRVTAPPTFARQILVPRLNEFARRHPQVELEIVLSVPVLDSAATEADVEIRNGDARQPQATQLMTDVVVPMASPELLRSLPPLKSPADLAHVPLVRSPLESWVTWFKVAGLPWAEPVSGPKFVDLGLAIEATVAGQGIALLRPALAANWLALGRLQPLFPVVAEPFNQYYLLPWVQRSWPDLFAQWLRSVCSETASESRALLNSKFSG